jgi:hypothetical protein
VPRDGPPYEPPPQAPNLAMYARAPYRRHRARRERVQSGARPPSALRGWFQTNRSSLSAVPGRPPAPLDCCARHRREGQSSDTGRQGPPNAPEIDTAVGRWLVNYCTSFAQFANAAGFSDLLHYGVNTAKNNEHSKWRSMTELPKPMQVGKHYGSSERHQLYCN